MAKHVVVLGAGLAGLTAAYRLVRQGYTCTLVEAANEVGGLASSFSLQGRNVERFYHFICRGDDDLLKLAAELGLQDAVRWKQTHTAFYYNGRTYPFGAPWHLLFFKPVPWLQRIRFGLHILRSRYRKRWQWIDRIPAQPWLIENIGEQAYNVIWHPLLRIKFGDDARYISAAWVWHRIWRVAKSRRRLWERESFGYLRGGSHTLVEALLAWLQAQPGFGLRLGQAAQAINWEAGSVSGVRLEDDTLPCDAVISTVALPQLEKLLPELEASSELAAAFMQNLRAIRYIGVVCMVLQLKQPFSRCFWTNINDSQVSFNGVIEQSNLADDLRQAGLNLLYIPFYLPTTEPRFRASQGDLLAEYLPMLKRVNPAFDESWIESCQVFRAHYAQAVCTVGFADVRPPLATPLAGLFLTDSTQFYPEDRTLSAAIQYGGLAAQQAMGFLHDVD